MNKTDKEISKKKEKRVIHLFMNGSHEYFSSPAALYDKYDVSILGITKASLTNHFSKCKSLGLDLEYTNDSCVIRKGLLHQRKDS